MSAERLDKLLATRLLLSRKEAQAAVRAGRVTVDGAPARDPAAKADPALQTVLLDGAAVAADQFFYLMLNKPAGVLSATEDRRGDRTALDLLPAQYQKAGLGVVGRLDKDAEGLLLLTNDGALNHRLTSPRHHAVKTYLVRTDAPADGDDAAAFAAGLALSDFTALPAGLELLDDGRALVSIAEGKFHQIKRMFQARGKTVLALKRLSIGPLRLDEGLPPGGWRPLSEAEKQAILQLSDRL